MPTRATPQMCPYQDLEAYQLTRTLLVGVYEATPQEDEFAHRLRTAAVAAVTSFVGVVSAKSSRLPESELPSSSDRLAKARLALAKVAETLSECHRQGHLAEHWYQSLSASQSRAAAALTTLD